MGPRLLLLVGVHPDRERVLRSAAVGRGHAVRSIPTLAGATAILGAVMPDVIILGTSSADAAPLLTAVGDVRRRGGKMHFVADYRTQSRLSVDEVMTLLDS
jgi:hypothetical protein